MCAAPLGSLVRPVESLAGNRVEGTARRAALTPVFNHLRCGTGVALNRKQSVSEENVIRKTVGLLALIGVACALGCGEAFVAAGPGDGSDDAPLHGGGDASSDAPADSGTDTAMDAG